MYFSFLVQLYFLPLFILEGGACWFDIISVSLLTNVFFLSSTTTGRGTWLF